jgi:tRNA (mo5U34)-methyltransferase
MEITMNAQQIRQKIDSFPVWHYEFELDGHRTPGRRLHRHPKRKDYFFRPMVELLGGLEGRRVLDLGCNAGFWALAAIESGADHVMGIDARQMHIDQAHLVFETKRIDPRRYEFMHGNIFDEDLTRFGAFDVVLCLGLLYHVNRPMELLESISAVNDDLLLIDTALSTLPGSCLELRSDDLDDPRNAVKQPLVMFPTRQAVCDLARQAGYRTAVLEPQFQDSEGVEDYQRGERGAFICAKRTPLAPLRAQGSAW